MMISAPTRSRRGLAASVGAVGALVVGGVLVATTVVGQDSSSLPAAAEQTTSRPIAVAPAERAPTPTASAPPAEQLPAALPESDPVRISIPSIGVDGPFVELGLTDASELETPANAVDVGWFTGGHTPGARGVAVVAGHVTYNGPAVFFRLGELTPGAAVEIERADGTTAVFAVRRSATFPKTEFPSAEVYRPSNRSELVLITCGGDYADAHYDSNVIVWAELVGSET